MGEKESIRLFACQVVSVLAVFDDPAQRCHFRPQAVGFRPVPVLLGLPALIRQGADFFRGFLLSLLRQNNAEGGQNKMEGIPQAGRLLR